MKLHRLFSNPWLRGVGLTLLMTGVVVVLMLWLVGTFQPKVSDAPVEAASRPVGDRPVEPVDRVSLPVTESAVGAIRPVHEVQVASKILAKVAEINVRAGDTVKAGDVLVRLEDSDLKARRDQAEAAVAAARANRNQAEVEHNRTKRLIEQNAATQIELDRVHAALLSAQAELDRAEWQLEEAETILDYATIAAPIDGVVIDKQVEAGDTVSPGQTLLQLYDPTRMQLVASVRESLTRRLEVGQTVPVEIESLGLECHGTISEIVPEAQSASRTFAVKVTGPCPEGVYPNMFGRLIIPLGNEQVLTVPVEAVRQVGQLNIVEVVSQGVLQRRSVQLGRRIDGAFEVLSGLRSGERVAIVGPPQLEPATTPETTPETTPDNLPSTEGA